MLGVADTTKSIRLYRNGTLGVNIFTYLYNVSFPNTAFSVADMKKSSSRSTGSSSSTGYYAGSCLFNNDGTKFFVCEMAVPKVRVYNTSKFVVPQTVSTYASADETIDLAAYVNNKQIHSSTFSDDGYYFFVYTNIGYADTIFRLALSKPFDLSVVKETTQLAGAKLTSPKRNLTEEIGDFCFSPDGNYLVVASANSSAQVIKWKLGTPWDITSTITLESYAKLQNTEGESCYGYDSGNGTAHGIAIDRAGTKMIVQFYAYGYGWSAVKYKFVEYNLE